MELNKNVTLSLSEMQLDTADQIYKPPAGPSIYNYTDGKKAENYIYRSVCGSKDISSDSDELMKRVKNWASYYHLGAGRSNILKILNLPPHSKVLELGCGCGAITRYLGEHFDTVHGVEGSEFRSKITRERCRDLNNVNVYNADIKSVKFDEKYDVATLIGVLEYAPSYFNNMISKQDSCLELLAKAKAALKDDGILIIAIENRIGLKYWSGSREDHTGKLFDGINGYPGNKKIITFSKKEMSDLLRNAGFSKLAFYYCFPDYKFASTILSDVEDHDSHFLHNWIDTPFISYDQPRKYLFNESQAIKSLSESGMLKEFANSFLVVAYNDGYSLPDPDWVVKKISISRKKEFRIITTLKANPCLQVEKVRLDGSRNIIKTSSKGITFTHRVEDSEWLKGDLLNYDIYKVLHNKNELNAIIKLYYNELSNKYSTGLQDSEGYLILRGNAVDAISKNALKLDDTINFIDEEWDMEKVTIDYVMYRCIKNMTYSQLFTNGQVLNTYKHTYNTLKEFFPQYNYQRHYNNTKQDRIFMDTVHEVCIHNNYLSTRLFNNSVFRKCISEIYINPYFFSLTKCIHLIHTL